MVSKTLIDVSEWNGDIKWDIVKDNIDGVIIRCGYGSDKTYQDDKKFKYNIDECTRLSIPFGVYIYSYAISEEDAKSEAEHVLRLIKGYDLSYPVYLDLEDDKIDTGNIKDKVKVFTDIIENAGYKCGIYANKYWWENKLNDINTYSKWVAQYYYKCTYTGDGLDIWQYSETGIVKGIDGYVDKNLCYRDFSFKTNLKSNEEIVLEVFDKKWGDGIERKTKLTDAGYDYKTIQDMINNRLSVKYHIVKSGDTLSAISRYYNVPISTLVMINNLINMNLIYVNQKIILR